MKRKAILATALAVLLGLMFGAACGGDDDSDGANDTTASDTTATASDATASGSAAPATATSSATKPAESTTAPGGEFAEFEALRIPPDLADGFGLGDPDAPVTLTLFEDFQCPFCLAFNLEFEPILLHDYAEKGTVRVEFRNFPILGQESVEAARATVCAAEQDVFWQLHNLLFLEQAEAGQLSDEQLNVGRFSGERLLALAEEAGADGRAFTVCMAAGSTLSAVQTQYVEGQGLGIRGTPGVVVNGLPVSIPRNEAELRKLLNDAIEAAE